MSRKNVIEIEYVRPKKTSGKILTTQEMMLVEQRLRSRLRHKKSKVITTEEIMRVEERLRNHQLARAVAAS